MSETRDKNQISTVLIGFLFLASIVGLGFVPVVITQANSQQLQLPSGRFLVGSLYLTLCMLGIVAVIFPGKCSGFFQKIQRPVPQTELSPKVGIKGHHPDCQRFSGNRIMFSGRALCAACSGLFVGAVVVLAGTFFQFFVGVNVGVGSVWVVVFGGISMLLGLGQIRLSGFAKVVANAVFVVGSFMVLAGADVLGENLLLDLYVVGLVGFLLWFRILLSQWNNARVCGRCRACFL